MSEVFIDIHWVVSIGRSVGGTKGADGRGWGGGMQFVEKLNEVESERFRLSESSFRFAPIFGPGGLSSSSSELWSPSELFSSESI